MLKGTMRQELKALRSAFLTMLAEGNDPGTGMRAAQLVIDAATSAAAGAPDEAWTEVGCAKRVCERISAKGIWRRPPGTKPIGRPKSSTTRSNRDKMLSTKYGMTQEDYDAMVAACDGRCEICGRRRKTLCIDHDHETGDIRGLLCHGCNTAIGKLGDTADAVMRAVAYLQRDPIRGRGDHRSYGLSDWDRFDATWTPEPTTGCWLWCGDEDRGGYAEFMNASAARYAYARAHGPVAGDILIVRNCDTRACVNPDHGLAINRRDAHKRRRKLIGESRFKGVRRHRNRWAAQVESSGTYHYLGTFDDEVAAARAYDAKAREIFGDLTLTNADLALYPPTRETEPSPISVG